MIKRGVPQESLDIVMSSMSSNTLNQYSSSIKSWWLFCKNNNITVYEPSIEKVLSFLTLKFNQGASYSSLNTHRSALSVILDKNLTLNDCINRFLKGAYRLRPPNPKYSSTWDTNVVLNHLSKLYPYESISLVDLSYKVCTLLAIASAQRMQTLSLIKLENV